MALSVEERINLATLQHSDPFIKLIKATAKHVTLYTYKSDANEWEKTDVEGTCFVYERSAPPEHGFMILNRLGRNNFVEPIRPNLEFQQQDPFLLYRTPPKIYGIWFYNADECKSISSLLHSLLESMASGPQRKVRPKVNTNTAPTTTPSNAGADILEMLSKAQTEFIMKAEPPGVTSKPSEGVGMVKPHPVKAAAVAEGRKSITIDELFKNVGISDEQQSSAGQSLPDDTHSTTAHTAFTRPLPPVQMTTVMELERQHTPDLVDPIQLLTPASLTASTAPPSTNHGIDPTLRLPQIGSSPAVVRQQSLVSDLTPQPELMSPMAFSIARRDPTKASPARIPVAINPPQHVSDLNLRSGFSKMRRPSPVDAVPLDSDDGAEESRSRSSIPSLTKNQLLQALRHLLDTDDTFLQTLHNAYVESLNSSLRR